MFHLRGSLGEFYSGNLSKETHKGKYERAKQGYHNGWVSWGYKSEMVGDRKLAVQTLSWVCLWCKFMNALLLAYTAIKIWLTG